MIKNKLPLGGGVQYSFPGHEVIILPRTISRPMEVFIDGEEAGHETPASLMVLVDSALKDYWEC
jgi:hypothetical protein